VSKSQGGQWTVTVLDLERFTHMRNETDGFRRGLPFRYRRTAHIEIGGTFILNRNPSVQTVGSKASQALSWTTRHTFPSATVSSSLSTSLTLPHPVSGPTSCVGKGLAILELRTVVCALIQKFEFEPAFRGEDWENSLSDWFVLVKGELPVRVKARKAYSHAQ
jgi:Cytochrome P450